MKKRYTYALECTVCKSRNYKVVRAADKKGDKLELKKYCKHCAEHVMHREVR